MAQLRRIGRVLSVLTAFVVVFALSAGPTSHIHAVELARVSSSPSAVHDAAPPSNASEDVAASDQYVELAQDFPDGPFVTNNGVIVGGPSPAQSGCVFLVEFWNFGFVPGFASVLIEAFDAEGGVEFILDATIVIAGSSAGGPTDIDATRVYNIQELLEQASPTTSEGYEVRLTVGAPFGVGDLLRVDDYLITDCIDLPPTATPSPTPEDPTETPTPEIPTETPTPEDPTETPTPEIPTATSTPEFTATPTSTSTAVPSPTFMPTSTPIPVIPPTSTPVPPVPTSTSEPPAPAPNPRDAPIVPPDDPRTSDGTRAGQVSVILAPGVDPNAIANRYGLTLLDFIELIRLALFGVPDGMDIADLLARMAGDPDVGDTEANSILMSPEGHDRSEIQFSLRTVLTVPDPRYGYDLVGAGNPGCVTGDGVVVAVLDTGIDIEHELFRDRLVPGWNVIDGNDDVRETMDGIDNNGNGVVDEMFGHGTHVAGIIAWIAPGAKIMPVRVLNDDGVGDAFGLAQGIIFAIDSGADVINLSLSSVTDSNIVRLAIEAARDAGVIVVAATGNAGHDDPKEYPAAIDGVIAVAATGPDDLKSEFSNYGDEIRMSAPGIQIESALPDGAYGSASGTSMAAPFIAAAVALAIERFPDLTPEEVADQIESASQVIDSLNPDYAGQLGAGRLDLTTALACN